MKRFRNNKNKWIILGFLLLTITIGYAALGTSLNINGTTGISNATWDIHWNNVQVTNGSVAISTGDRAATITQGNTQEVTYAVTLNTPGDFYEFTVDVVNAGSIDGMIDTITSTYKIGDGEVTTITSNNLPAYLNYSVTYSDGLALAPNQYLKSGKTETYKVRIEFKKDIENNQLPGSTQSILFGFAVHYKQADSNAVEVVHPVNGTRYTVNECNIQLGLPINVSPNIGYANNRTIYYETAAEARAAFDDKPFYLRHTIVNHVVSESYVELYFGYDSETDEEIIYSLRGGIDESNLTEKPIYEENLQTLINLFGYSSCDDQSYSYRVTCSDYGLNAGIDTSGNVYVTDNNRHGCEIDYGYSDCWAM